MKVVFPSSLYDYWLLEDLGPFDLTTAALGIGKMEGLAEVVLRERGVVCGLEEAKELYLRAGAEEVELLAEEGEEAEGTVMRVYGKAEALHKAWRVAQNVVAITSGVATYTRKMKEKLKSINPKAELVVVRKAPPCRAIYYKGVLCGGASLHRTTLSDTVILFKNHTVFIPFEEALRRLKESSLVFGKPITIEAESLEEALKAAEAGFDVQLDHFPPEEFRKAYEEIKRINPNVKVYAAGGINIKNVEDYAIADAVLTSAPYWAKPLDVTTRMRRA